MPDAAALFDLYLLKDFFDASICREIIAELAQAPEAPATVYGKGEAGAVDEKVRKVARRMPSPETFERVRSRLLEVRGEVGAHFGVELGSCEEPQFLHYREGDFFVAHQDGNTGMLLSDREQFRKLSVTIFLNQQSEISEAGAYGGGSLVFSEWRADRQRGRYELAGEAGTLVAFTSDTTHEVIPIMWGERYSIVSWYG